jgi:hypothetical protein
MPIAPQPISTACQPGRTPMVSSSQRDCGSNSSAWATSRICSITAGLGAYAVACRDPIEPLAS